MLVSKKVKNKEKMYIEPIHWLQPSQKWPRGYFLHFLDSDEHVGGGIVLFRLYVTSRMALSLSFFSTLFLFSPPMIFFVVQNGQQNLALLWTLDGCPLRGLCHFSSSMGCDQICSRSTQTNTRYRLLRKKASFVSSWKGYFWGQTV